LKKAHKEVEVVDHLQKLPPNEFVSLVRSSICIVPSLGAILLAYLTFIVHFLVFVFLVGVVPAVAC